MEQVVVSPPELNALYKRVMAMLNVKLGKKVVVVPVLDEEVKYAEEVAKMWREIGWPAQYNGQAIILDFQKAGRSKKIKKKWWQFWK